MEPNAASLDDRSPAWDVMPVVIYSFVRNGESGGVQKMLPGPVTFSMAAHYSIHVQASYVAE